MSFFKKLYNLEYKNKYKVLFFSFVCLFVCFLIAFLPFIVRGNLLIWGMDGSRQHYPFLQYSMQNFSNVFLGAFDFNLGLGSDFVFALSYYMLTDPFNLIYFPLSFINCSLAYTLATVCKFVAIYYVMFLFLKHKNVKPIYAVLGAVCYMFVGAALFSVPRHPQFAAGLIFFPLMVWGAENVMAEKRPYLLIFSVLLCALSNYYQLYMSVICLAIFVCFYYFVLHPTSLEKFSFKKFAYNVLKVGIFGLIGMLIAAFALVPTLVGMLNSARGGSKGFNFTTGLDIENILLLATGYLLPVPAKNYCILGLNFVLTLLVCLYLVNKNKGKTLIACFICFMFIPFFGFALNVFNYYSGRWLFALAFLLVVAAMVALSKLDKTEGEIKLKAIKLFLSFLIITAALGISYLVSLLSINISGALTILTVFIINVIGVVGAILLYKKVKLPNKLKDIFSAKIVVPILFAVSVVSACVFNVVYSKDFAKYSSPVETFDFENYVAEQNKGKLARVDMGQDVLRQNYNINKNYLSTFMYNSSSSASVYNFLNKVGLQNKIDTRGINGLEDRVALQALLNVNYYVATDKNIPFGYQKVEGFENLYYNKNYLTFGSFFENAVSQSLADKTALDERGNIMLEAVVIDDDNLNYLPATINEKIDFDINLTNCEIEKDTIVCQENAKIEINLFNTLNKEVYLNLTDFGFNWESGGMARKLTSPNQNKKFYVATPQRTICYELAAPTTNAFNAYTSNYCINLGYVQQNNLTATISLPEGEYKFKNIYSSAYNMQKFEQDVTALKDAPQFVVEDFENYNGRNLNGTINNETNGYLFLSIPYSKGWSAKVDGKNANILCANYGFMAIKLDAGLHKIELKYVSPGLKAGQIISIIGAGCLIFTCFVDLIVVITKRKNKISNV